LSSTPTTCWSSQRGIRRGGILLLKATASATATNSLAPASGSSSTSGPVAMLPSLSQCRSLHLCGPK
jgi:hypothetical protein